MEVQIKKLYCVSRAAKTPITIEDASRSEADIEKASKVTYMFIIFQFHVVDACLPALCVFVDYLKWCRKEYSFPASIRIHD